MKKDIIIPQLGESISEASICNIIVESGSQVEMDAELFEIETDKVNQVVYAPCSGKLSLDLAIDELVKVGQTVGSVDASKKGTQSEPKKDVETAEDKKIEAPKTPPKEAPPQEKIVLEKIATEAKGVLRVSKDDFLKSLHSVSPKADLPIQVERPKEERKKMSRIRKVIAKRLVEVKNETAMLTTFNEVDMSKVMELRALYKEAFQKKHGVKLGFMSFFTKAVISALKDIPDILAYIQGEEIVYRNTYDIGIAVGTEKGLMVPVIRDADKMNFAEVEKAIINFAKKARDGSIAINDISGGGFTITNGGVYGSLLSTPILNPPQSGILGLHKIQKRACVIDDKIEIKPMMYLALSYDHRIVDGKEAVTFLVKIKEALEEPSRFLLEV